MSFLVGQRWNLKRIALEGRFVTISDSTDSAGNIKQRKWEWETRLWICTATKASDSLLFHFSSTPWPVWIYRTFSQHRPTNTARPLALAQVSIRAVPGRIVPLRGEQKGTGAVEFKQHRLTQAAERTVIDLTSVNPPGTFQSHRFGLLFPSHSVSRLELPPREDHINYTNQSETCCFISLPKTTWLDTNAHLNTTEVGGRRSV